MSYSCNDNQNYFWEADKGRTTSRVLAPPGGKTSICLGGYTEPPKPKKKQAEAVAKQAAEEVQKQQEEKRVQKREWSSIS
jgi:hypothetical protein